MTEGTPTPTQDELNQLAEGKNPTLADDGSGPDPNVVVKKQSQADKTGQPIAKK